MESLIKYYIREKNSDLSKQQVQELENKINVKIARLGIIKEKINNTTMLHEKMVSKRSQLHNILGENGRGLSLKNKELEGQKELINQIGKLIYEAYHLTSEILQELGAIDSVNYTFTYQNKETGDFYRAEDIQLDPEQDLTFEMHKNALIIRLKETEIKHKILAQQADKKVEWVAQHFNDFSEPLRKAEAKRKKFKINQGYLSEAFERHWEELQHSIEVPTPKTEFDEGYVWYLYFISTGRDPYYTGPDTAASQVKNANASIISNANTVLNTLEAILTISEKKVSSEEAASIKAQYDKAFAAKDPHVKRNVQNFSKKIGRDAARLLKQEMAKRGIKIKEI